MERTPDNASFHEARQPVWRMLGVLILIAFGLYGITLFYGFPAFDDDQMIQNNREFLSSPANIPQVFTGHFFNPVDPTGTYYRPLATLLFMAGTLLGGGAPWAFHLLNVLLHLASAILLFRLTRSFASSEAIPFLAAVLFLVHPGNATAVALPIGGHDLLMAVFGLAALLGYFRWRQGGDAAWLAVHGVAFFLMLLTKESAIAIPPLCLLGAFLMASEKWSWADQPWALWLGTGLLWMMLRILALGTMAFSGGQAVISLEQLRGLGFCWLGYLGKTGIPLHLALTPTPVETPVWPGVAVLALGVVAGYLATPATRRKMAWGLAGFSLFILLGIFSFSAGGLYRLGLMEYRLYLPLGLVVAAGGWLAADRIPKRAAIAGMAALIVVFSVMTIRRLPDFRNAESFWKRAVELSPASDYAHISRAALLLGEGRLEEAHTNILAALRTGTPGRSEHLALGVYYRKKGQFEEAKAEMRKELELYPSFMQAYEEMAELCMEAGWYAEADQWRHRAQQKLQEMKKGTEFGFGSPGWTPPEPP